MAEPSTPQRGSYERKTSNLAFPFKRSASLTDQNLDLLGRSYAEGDAVITVIEICPCDESRVMVERDLDGRTWSMPGWLMRLIFMEKKKGRRAA